MTFYKNYDPAVTERKRKNAEIFKDTTATIKAGAYTTPSGKTNELNLEPMVSGSVCYHTELPVQQVADAAGGTRVMVEMNDCLVAAQRLVSEGYNPALLNFASAGHPGGGVENGARAQEETICRRSTLTRSIYAFDQKYAAKYGYEHKDGNNYPLDDLNFSAVYSPAVTVFKEGLECTPMEEPYQVAVITCAALNLNGMYSLALTPDGHMPEMARAVTRNKVRTIFRIALSHGHDSLVLGAFGCGAFKNPPAEVAAIFHEILEEPEFKNKFRLITFSIIEDHNSNKRNLRAFEKVFGNNTSQGMEKTIRRPAPDLIMQLEPGQIFVFGSNLQGAHAGGAARIAAERFGAIWGQGVGLQGQSYAIPTMQGPASSIKPYVDEFIDFADSHPEYEFLVTRIGCGIAGFRDEQIAPLFKAALKITNIRLPRTFLEILDA